MKLYFENSQGEERLIAECDTVSAVHKEIKKFLDEHKYVSHYSRTWGDNEKIMIDFGSHSEFFLIEGISFDKYVKEIQKDAEIEEYHQITMDEYLESLQNS